MNHVHTALFKTLRVLTIASACLAPAAYADTYTDVSQLFHAGKFSEALTKVDGYLASKPADPQLRFLKGVIQRNLGKQAEAIATFTKLTEDYPELPEPYNNLAVLYAGQGQFDKARIALEMAIRTNPSYATAHENLGDVYARLASQAYNKALQLDGSNAAVPPKLALISEVFKPNLSNARPTPAVPLAPATVVAAAPAKPAPVAAPQPAKSAPAAAPQPASAAPVAVTKPAAPAANVAAAVVKPAPQAAPQPAAASETTQQVEAAVNAWAHAWSSKNIGAYLKAYSPDFTPAGKQARPAWEQDRRNRIVGKASISVTLSNLKVRVTGDKAVANFRQSYKAGALAVSSRKTLELQKSGNQWLITRESTGN